MTLFQPKGATYVLAHPQRRFRQERRSSMMYASVLPIF